MRRRPAAERLLKVASELFYREGIRAVGVDTLSEKAGVSKRTLYNRFGGKDELVAAYLRHRDERWRARLGEVAEGLTEPREKLLAIFRVYEEWISGEGFRGCAFANAAAEIPDPNHPARIAAQEHKNGVRGYLAAVVAEAGLDNPETLSEHLLLLLEGATATAAMRRDGEPLKVARSAALDLIGGRPY